MTKLYDVPNGATVRWRQNVYAVDKTRSGLTFLVSYDGQQTRVTTDAEVEVLPTSAEPATSYLRGIQEADDALRRVHPTERIDHPAHYGGKDNPYEAIKVIDAWGVGFALGNTLKYIARAGRKPTRLDVSTCGQPNQFIDGPISDGLDDLKKARWYLDHEIAAREAKRRTT